jgi:hypothetical protein
LISADFSPQIFFSAYCSRQIAEDNIGRQDASLRPASVPKATRVDRTGTVLSTSAGARGVSRQARSPRYRSHLAFHDAPNNTAQPLKAGVALTLGIPDHRNCGVMRTGTGLDRGRLCRQCWIAGETLSAADVNLYPFLASLERALLQPAAAQLDLELTPITDRFPGIGRWMRAVQALHGYERTMPTHWK